MDRTGALLISPQTIESSHAVPKMRADPLSDISTVVGLGSPREREKQEMKELGYAFTAEIIQVVSENSTVLR